MSRKPESNKYGNGSEFYPEAEETGTEEYKSGGLPKTSKYSVDKKKKSEPSVTTPKDTKEQSDRPADANYGF